MPRRGENIYKRKDGRWEGRYIKGRVEGKTKYGYVFARTYKEAKLKLNAFKGGENPVPGEAAERAAGGPEKCFGEAAEEWFVQQSPQWKQSSAIKYANILNSYLLPEFACKNVSRITRDETAAFCSRLLTEGGAEGTGLSPKTVTCILSVMKNVLKYAEQIKGCAVPDLKGISPRQSQKSMRILSCGEQQRLGKYLCRDMCPCNLGILICLYTGLRVGEICALKWEDVFFEEQYLFVRRTMQRLQLGGLERKKQGEDGAGNGMGRTAVIVSAPKSDCSVRKVPIPEEVFKLMKECRGQADAFLLTGSASSYMEPRTMQNRFKAVAKDCGIEDATFHTLRHTFATRCVELGFDIKSLSEILGHASVNITLNRYVHPSMELKQKNMNMLSELFAV